jgi:hypothetical protein
VLFAHVRVFLIANKAPLLLLFHLLLLRSTWGLETRVDPTRQRVGRASKTFE